MSDIANRPNEDTPEGLALAGTAYVLWGFLPLYLKLVAHIPVTEVITHRIIWALPIAGALLIVTGRTADLRAALSDRRTVLMALLTALVLWSIGASMSLPSPRTGLWMRRWAIT